MRWMWLSIAGELKVGKWLKFRKTSFEQKNTREKEGGWEGVFLLFLVLEGRQANGRSKGRWKWRWGGWREWNQGKVKEQKRQNRKPQPRDIQKATYLVCYYCHSRIIKVQPGRNLPIGDYENIPNPWRMPLDRSQWVPQFFIIFKTAGRNVFILLGLRKTPGARRCKIALKSRLPVSPWASLLSGCSGRLLKTQSYFETLQKLQKTQLSYNSNTDAAFL